MKNQYTLDYYNEEEIRKLLFGRKIIKVDSDTLFLDNGIELTISPNSGCGGCGSGWYSLVELNDCDNAITNIEMVVDENVKDKYDDTSYKIFVFAEDKRIKIVQVDGSDGNGYYGTGYEILVKFKNEDKM